MSYRVVLLLLLSTTGSLLVTNSLAQPVRIDSLRILDPYGGFSVIRPQGVVSLPARANYLTVYCSAPQPGPMQYRLDGLDAANVWHNSYTRDRIHYANLDGGSYRFLVRSGPTSSPAQLAVEIEAPFWRRWWFVPTVLLYVLGVAGILLYLFLRYRFRQKLRDLQARDRIARDLHDDMGSYLSSISILSASARRNALKSPEKTQASLDKIGTTARQMLDTMGDIVWSINPAHDAMSHVLDRMRDVGNALFANTDTEFIIQADDDLGTYPLATEARHDFFLLYKEALTNAARYAQASRVRVSLRRSGGTLLLTIQDDGCGFDPTNPIRQNASGGNGLGNLQKRAHELGGTLTIESVAGEGTTVSLRLSLP